MQLSWSSAPEARAQALVLDYHTRAAVLFSSLLKVADANELVCMMP